MLYVIPELSAPAFDIWTVQVCQTDGSLEQYEINRQLRQRNKDVFAVCKDGTPLHDAYTTCIAPGRESCTCKGAEYGYRCLHLDMCAKLREMGTI